MNVVLINLCKGLILLFVAASLLATGTGDESLEIVSLSYSLELQQISTVYVVVAGIFSAWLGVLGMMCLYLEKIPGAVFHRKRKQESE